MQLKNKYQKDFEDLKPIPPEAIPTHKDLLKDRGMDSVKVPVKPEIILEQKEEANKMKGWKTWTAGIGLIIWGVVGWLVGVHTANEMITYVLSGLGTLGIGHKIEKSTTK